MSGAVHTSRVEHNDADRSEPVGDHPWLVPPRGSGPPGPPAGRGAVRLPGGDSALRDGLLLSKPLTRLAARSSSERERIAEQLLDQLTPVMSALGGLFLLVVLGERAARPGSGLAAAFTVVGWLLWAVFAVEFVARLVVAPDTRVFLRRHGWQVLFLVLPFLRVLRLVRAVRVLRAGRLVSGAVRGSRSTARVLGSRLGWLAVTSAILVLAVSQLLFELGSYPRYGEALHDTALAAISGEPLGRPDPLARVVEVFLAAYSVAVFATLAGTVGAYFLRAEQPAAPTGEHTR